MYEILIIIILQIPFTLIINVTKLLAFSWSSTSSVQLMFFPFSPTGTDSMKAVLTNNPLTLLVVTLKLPISIDLPTADKNPPPKSVIQAKV